MSIKGVWAEFADSSYRESIYGDSTTWVYTEEAGVVKTKYKIHNRTVTRYYMNGEEFLSYLIESAEDNEFVYQYNGHMHKKTRLKIDVDLEKLMADDTIEFARYLAGYFARRDSAMSSR